MLIHLILVAPARAENVGAAARAMKTMGFSSLRIVDSEVHKLPQAEWVAHGAQDILDEAESYETLSDALADIDFSVATTARERAKFKYYCEPDELVQILTEKAQYAGNVALVFGREATGLTNEELELVDLLTGVPMANHYPSLNLGQAVMVYCYQLSKLTGELMMPDQHQAESETETEEAPAEHKESLGALRVLRSRAHQLLHDIGVANDLKLADWLDQRLGFLEQRDIAMLHTLLQDIEKSVKK